LGLLPFEHLRRYCDEMATVSEDEIAEAVRVLAHRARLVIEPSGAVAMAAHLFGIVPQPAGDDTRVIVLSGGNVDPEVFRQLLAGSS
jgi:threonine dehydratase